MGVRSGIVDGKRKKHNGSRVKKAFRHVVPAGGHRVVDAPSAGGRSAASSPPSTAKSRSGPGLPGLAVLRSRACARVPFVTSLNGMSLRQVRHEFVSGQMGVVKSSQLGRAGRVCVHSLDVGTFDGQVMPKVFESLRRRLHFFRRESVPEHTRKTLCFRTPRAKPPPPSSIFPPYKVDACFSL